MEEIWKPAKYIKENGEILDFSGIYEVSNFGKIRSLDKIRIKNGKSYYYKGKLLNIWKNERYYSCNLIYKGKSYKCTIHRTVLSSFNPDGWFKGAVCNHKDYNIHNNSIENLEWVTIEENNNYGNRNIKLSKSLSGIYNKTGGCKIVLQYDLNNNFMKEWPSASEVGRFYKVSKASIINCCLGKVKTSCGYIFKYK